MEIYRKNKLIMIKIKGHNAGFFSCCSVKLTKIVEFINSNKRLPDNVDSSEQFSLYKDFNPNYYRNNTIRHKKKKKILKNNFRKKTRYKL